MGQQYEVRCTSCDYHISVTEGVGMMYSPHAVFYGYCDDPSRNWSMAFPDGYCETGKPLLNSLVESEKIKEGAFKFIKAGATPTEYGHALYACLKCHRLYNEFHFVLVKGDVEFEPDYECPLCNELLRRVKFNDGISEVTLAYANGKNEDLICPKCCNKSLKCDGISMNWD